jgi:hypothetical protein
MIIGEKNTDLKKLTGRLKLRFLTEIGQGANHNSHLNVLFFAYNNILQVIDYRAKWVTSSPWFQ